MKLSLYNALILLLVFAFNVEASVDSEPLGKWEISPERLISGTSTPIELRYRNGKRKLPPGTSFVFDLEPISVKQLVHTPASTDFAIVPWQGEPPKVKLEEGKLTGIGYFSNMKFVFPEGVEPGQSFAMRIGNRTETGEIIGMVTPIPVHGLSFNIKARLGEDGEQFDWFENGWHQCLPRCDIEGGSAAALRITGPTLVQANIPFALKIAVTDAFDAGCYPTFIGNVGVTSLAGVSNLPAEISFSKSDRSSKVVEGLSISQPGVYRVQLTLNGNVFESNPIIVRTIVDKPIYWGFLHSHNWYSECWGDGPRETYRFARDVSGMDFVGLSDHIGSTPSDETSLGRLLPYRLGENRTAKQAWEDCLGAADEYNTPGKFTALLGYEFSDVSCSHYIVYWTELNKHNYPAMWPPFLPDFQSQLLAPLGEIDAMIIPHVHGTYVPYSEWNVGLTKSGYPLMPAIEAISDWGMAFPGYGVKDPLLGGASSELCLPFPMVIARGYKKVGIIGDSDNHEGLPGRRIQAAMAPGHAISPQGLTAVPAKELTRQGIIDGYRTRATYATSGEHIFLEMIANGVGMGGELKSDKPVKLQVQVNGTDAIQEVNLWDGTGIINTKKFGTSRDLSFSFDIPAPNGQEAPYFVEVIQSNHHRAWSSPLWIGKKSLPDLGWETDADGQLSLVNRGPVPATNIRVMADSIQSPLAIPSIAPAPGNIQSPAAQVQLRRWNDHKVTVFYYYKGPKTKQIIEINGSKSYLIEPNRGQWWHGTQTDDTNGKIEFTNAGGQVSSTDDLTRSEWRGLDITIELDLDKPCSVTFRHDNDFPTHIGNEVLSGKNVTLNLNTLSLSPPKTITISRLAPGQKHPVDGKFQVYSADPQNKIIESNENNNLLKAK